LTGPLEAGDTGDVGDVVTDEVGAPERDGVVRVDVEVPLGT